MNLQITIIKLCTFIELHIKHPAPRVLVHLDCSHYVIFSHCRKLFVTNNVSENPAVHYVLAPNVRQMKS